MHPNDPNNPNNFDNAPALAQPMNVARTTSGGAVEVEQQRAIAETQAMMIIAKKFPRDQQESLKRITESCKRVTLAEQAVYEYARGGTDITGPSIRLAEAMAQIWGNMQFGIRELSQQNGESTVEAFAWDIETNTRQVKIFQVPHKRYTRKGSYALTDPRDIYELVANNGARRLRACILGVIPGDVQEAALKQAEETVLKSVDLSKESIDKLVAAFSAFNVTQKMIEKRIQRDIAAITARNVLGLRRVYTSLKDGMGDVGDYFDTALQPAAKGDVATPTQAQSPAKKTSKAKPAAEAQPEPQQEAAPETQETQQKAAPATQPEPEEEQQPQQRAAQPSFDAF